MMPAYYAVGPDRHHPTSHCHWTPLTPSGPRRAQRCQGLPIITARACVYRIDGFMRVSCARTLLSKMLRSCVRCFETGHNMRPLARWLGCERISARQQTRQQRQETMPYSTRRIQQTKATNNRCWKGGSGSTCCRRRGVRPRYAFVLGRTARHPSLLFHVDMDDNLAAHLAAACSRSALQSEAYSRLRDMFSDCKLLRWVLCSRCAGRQPCCRFPHPTLPSPSLQALLRSAKQSDAQHNHQTGPGGPHPRLLRPHPSHRRRRRGAAEQPRRGGAPRQVSRSASCRQQQRGRSGARACTQLPAPPAACRRSPL